MDARESPEGKQITQCQIDPEKLKARMEVLEVKPKTQEKGIEDAEIIVVSWPRSQTS